jgi:hypothetical protein
LLATPSSIIFRHYAFDLPPIRRRFSPADIFRFLPCHCHRLSCRRFRHFSLFAADTISLSAAIRFRCRFDIISCQIRARHTDAASATRDVAVAAMPPFS